MKSTSSGPPRELLYRLERLAAFIEGQDRGKTEQASALIEANEPSVSTQIVNETCVNLVRRAGFTAGFTEAEVRETIASFYRRYPVYQLTQATLVNASELRERYSLSFWDSVIVLAALEAGVPRLYSEDMQDGLIVDGRLEIINLFRDADGA